MSYQIDSNNKVLEKKILKKTRIELGEIFKQYMNYDNAQYHNE